MTARPSSNLVDSSSVARFLATVGLTTPADDATARRLADQLGALVAATPEIPADDEKLLALFRFVVPKLGPGGSCSISHELEPEPFDLRGDALRGLSLADSGVTPKRRASPGSRRSSGFSTRRPGPTGPGSTDGSLSRTAARRSGRRPTSAGRAGRSSR